MDLAQPTRAVHTMLRACQKSPQIEMILLTLILVFPSACTKRDPQAAFEHAQKVLEQGDINSAAKEAEVGYKDFHTVNSEWAWKFTILRGRVLHWQGRNDEMLALFGTEPNPPSTGELAVKKLWLTAQIF